MDVRQAIEAISKEFTSQVNGLYLADVKIEMEEGKPPIITAQACIKVGDYHPVKVERVEGLDFYEVVTELKRRVTRAEAVVSETEALAGRKTVPQISAAGPSDPDEVPF